MRSPLECIEGKYEHALFTTYSINLRFFEEWVLPLLREAGVRNTTVFVDEAQLGSALSDRSLRFIGRTYHVVSVRLGPGAFHPKMFLLAGESGARACVSSANLTVDGQLRNVESAVVLDSSAVAHRQSIVELGRFVREITEAAPVHSAEAVMGCLEVVDDVPADRPQGPFRIVHNLHRPLVDLFPTGGLTAVTPYADSGRAAAALSERGALTVVTDAAEFAAPESFFGSAWSVFPLDFEKRRLHGKAYWGTTESWLMLGSPNLSRQALLQTASEANTELAVVLQPHEPQLAEPPGTPAPEAELEAKAPQRHALGRASDRRLEIEPGSFNAWEDERSIVLDGVPADSTVEFWQAGGWHLLGTLVGDRIDPPQDVRPYLIRCISPKGQVKQAVVHRTEPLRIHRLRPRTTSRAAETLTSLPLDLAGVQALESVLRDLYLLAALANENTSESPTGDRRSYGEDGSEPTGDLGEWVPARPEDEPRIPEVYRRAWKNQPDALLALIRSALRLEGVITPASQERDVYEESLDLDDPEKQEGEEETQPAPESEAPVEVERAVLTRYRNSLAQLLRRGSEYVRDVPDPALADLAFLSILALHERIEQSPVAVDGELVVLVDEQELLTQKLALLEAYLADRDGRYAHCLATARVHLSKCLAIRKAWTPLQWEQLESLAHRHAGKILAADEYAAAAADAAGESLLEITERIRPYADRSAWDGYLALADDLLDDTDLHTGPFLWIEGEEWIEALDNSPAWRLIGYGAVAGFRDRQPYGVLVRNSLPRSNHLSHLLVCEPAAHRLHELFLRAADRRWLARTYRSVNEGDLDDAGKFGVEGLLQAGADRTSFEEVIDFDGIVGSLLRTIMSAHPAAT